MHQQGKFINIINVMMNIIKAKKLFSQNQTGFYTYVYEWKLDFTVVIMCLTLIFLQ